MKKIVTSIVIIAALSLAACKKEAKKEITVEQNTTESTTMSENTFGVRGNCNMCKSTIEKAAKNIDGVAKANWDKTKKEINVSFDASKTSAEAIHQAIAAAGYDTDQMSGKEEAYNELPNCCQYSHTMKMSRKDGEVSDDKDTH